MSAHGLDRLIGYTAAIAIFFMGMTVIGRAHFSHRFPLLSQLSLISPVDSIGISKRALVAFVKITGFPPPFITIPARVNVTDCP